jgi:transposase InsO family protein
MPFASKRHHEFWTADVRYLDMLDEELLADGMVYAITILENYSRALLASSVTRRQDLNAFLSVLYRAIQHYGPPEAFVTDSGSIFLANRAQAIYRALGIRKLEIEKGQPWQSYLQTAWGVQEHYAHQHRKKGKRSPSEVLSWVRTPRYAPLPGGGPRPGVLLGSLYTHPRRPGLPHPSTLQALRRRGARRNRGRRVGGRGQSDR